MGSEPERNVGVDAASRRRRFRRGKRRVVWTLHVAGALSLSQTAAPGPPHLGRGFFSSTRQLHQLPSKPQCQRQRTPFLGSWDFSAPQSEPPSASRSAPLLASPCHVCSSSVCGLSQPGMHSQHQCNPIEALSEARLAGTAHRFLGCHLGDYHVIRGNGVFRRVVLLLCH